MGIPANIIIAWSGSISNIPNGWLLCDGTNGTPDLRNRFTVGAGAKHFFQQTGGSADSVVVSHTHTTTLNTTGNHTHQAISRSGQTSVNTERYVMEKVQGQYGIATTSTDGLHGHSISVDNSGTNLTNRNLPPYYALAFVMKEG
jgi:microcystin-dependent protein